MKTAHFHRAYWSYDYNLGIAKIHHPKLGIFAMFFENMLPKANVNFLDKSQLSYYWQKYKKMNIQLTLGVQVDRDVELIRVEEQDNFFRFSEINLEVTLENNLRLFRCPCIQENWQPFQDDVFVEYKPCESLIDVR